MGAHPRSRGEHEITGRFFVPDWGSSPLARGTRVFVAVFICLDGLIPARAGNTDQAESYRAHDRAHPRSRGEHERMNPKIAAQLGSSPLARGTQMN